MSGPTDDYGRLDAAIGAWQATPGAYAVTVTQGSTLARTLPRLPCGLGEEPPVRVGSDVGGDDYRLEYTEEGTRFLEFYGAARGAGFAGSDGETYFVPPYRGAVTNDPYIYRDGFDVDRFPGQGKYACYADPSSAAQGALGPRPDLRPEDFDIPVGDQVCTYGGFFLFQRPTRVERADSAPPTSTSQLSPAPNAAGWSNSDVTVTLNSTDGANGSGVARIVYETAGAQTASATTIAGDQASVTVRNEGLTTVTFYAVDGAGNAEAPTTVQVKLDRRAPTIVYTGNAGTYAVDQMVAIRCHASDALAGVIEDHCRDVTSTADSFQLGINVLSASAADAAGNVGVATAELTIVVTPGALARLTTRYVESSSKYKALPTWLRTAIDRTGQQISNQLEGLLKDLSPANRAAIVRAYQTAVRGLATQGWLTGEQAATLIRFSAAL